MNAHDVTFYVPTRNNAATLDACLRSVRAQTTTPAEILVVVDCRSTDETLAVARAHPVRIIEQHDGTLGTARNLAIEEATTPWLACCDADVTLDPRWLETLIAARPTDVAGIAGRTDEASHEPPDRWRALHMPHHWGDAPLQNPFMLVSEVLFDRRALLAVGGYRNDLNNYEDSDLCQRLRDAGFDLYYEPTARAWHHRRDSLLGVLDLRWRYAEYRQRHAFSSFTGLLTKLDVNHEYAQQTLSKTLTTRNEHLSYLSFLLFYHHALADLEALLRLRPLISPPERIWYRQYLTAELLAALNELDNEIAVWVAHDLEHWKPANWIPCEPPTAPPKLADFAARVAQRSQLFVQELPAGVRAVIAASAAYCHGQELAEQVPTLQPPTVEQVQAWLNPIPIEPALTDGACERWRQTWPDAKRARLVGTLHPSERSALAARIQLIEDRRPADGADIVICPHLESFAKPLDQLRELQQQSRRLIVSYRPPKRFILGLDIPAARDLASTAVQAGWQILRFETLVGRTSLMLERQPAS